ncbi:41758_t:CDS:1, partial [Gigaspora margarita]
AVSETSNIFDIIDETSNASSSLWSDIWKFFAKEKKEKLLLQNANIVQKLNILN